MSILTFGLLANQGGGVAPTSYTAKSVILDIADNWGGSQVSLRSIEFFYQGLLISVTSGFTAYNTEDYDGTNRFNPEFAFDTSLSKIGMTNLNGWYGKKFVNTNQRLICVFDTPVTFDTIVINNAHYSGGNTNTGAKNTKIHISTDEITSVVYDAAIANSTKIYDGIFDEHVASDVEDEQTLTLIEPLPTYTAKSIVLDIADNWGDVTWTSIRQIDFYKDGAVLEIDRADLTVYGPEHSDPTWSTKNLFDSSLDVLWDDDNNSWLATSTSSIRIICVFDSAIEFDTVVVMNSHQSVTESGSYYYGPFTTTKTDRGAKNVKIHTSTDSITDTTYDAAISNSTEIFDGQLTEHSTNNIFDREIIFGDYHDDWVTSII